MRKLLLLTFALIGILGLVLLLWGQTVVSYAYQSPQTIFTAVAPGSGMRIIGTGAAFHQLTWNTQGTVTTCQIQVDSSADGSSWNSGDIIASTACTSANTVLSTSHVVNFVRINVTTLSGAGATITALLSGYANNPSGGGGSGTVSACAGTGNAYYSGAGTTVSCDTSLVDDGSGHLTTASGAAGTNAVTVGSGVGFWGTITTFNVNVGASNGTFALYNGATLNAQHIIGTNYLIANALGGGNVIVEGRVGAQTATPTVILGNTNTIDYTATAGAQTGIQIGLGASAGSGNLRFAPTSGTATFIGFALTPQINQTGGANGNSTDLLISPTLTAVGGTHNFLDMGTGGSGGIFTISSVGAITDAQGTLTTSQPFISHTATWNAGGVTFTDIVQNLTCTAAASGSIAMGIGTAGTQWAFRYGAANCGSPQLLVPSGTAANASIANSGAVNTGISTPSNAAVCTDGGGNYGVCDISGGGLQGPSTGFYSFTSTGLPTGAQTGAKDTGIGRTAAAVLSVDDGTPRSENGIVRSANACRVTADITLPVNTATTVCTWSLPAVAKAWAWQCSILWTITAGTGTNNLAINVNPSQTPTGTTNGEAQIYTATSGTQTMGNAAISASGSTTLLTGATYTPAATIQLAKTSGTLLASATAGTFAITATANGTTATAAAKAGSTCILY